MLENQAVEPAERQLAITMRMLPFKKVCRQLDHIHGDFKSVMEAARQCDDTQLINATEAVVRSLDAAIKAAMAAKVSKEAWLNEHF